MAALCDRKDESGTPCREPADWWAVLDLPGGRFGRGQAACTPHLGEVADTLINPEDVYPVKVHRTY